MTSDLTPRNAIEMCLPPNARQKIEALMAEPTDDFVALVRAAGLDPKTSFRGKTLRIDFGAADLSGFDFSGADLSGCSILNAKLGSARLGARIFISYAHSDGSAAAESLIQILAANGHTAWQDLRHLGPEEAVLPQIENGLKAAEFLIVLVTPAALKSEHIQQEWREARRNGMAILPVMEMKQSRSTLPRWLRRSEVYDLAEPIDRERFLARLNSTSGTGDSFRADWDAGPEIETFIDRPQLIAEIKTQLLSKTFEPVSSTFALLGPGGSGKSVLAGEIARDPEIRDAFIDGVFWIRLGQDNPDVLGQINHLIRRISGADGAPDVQTAAMKLNRLLEKRDVLIILDDVWHKQDLFVFVHATGEGNAKLLATTRALDVLPRSAQTIVISGLEPDEAMGLLALGLAPDEDDQEALSQFALDCSNLPLFLAIANGFLRDRMRDGDTLTDALSSIAESARQAIDKPVSADDNKSNQETNAKAPEPEGLRKTKEATAAKIDEQRRLTAQIREVEKLRRTGKLSDIMKWI